MGLCNINETIDRGNEDAVKSSTGGAFRPARQSPSVELARAALNSAVGA